MASPVMEHAYYIGNFMGGILYGVDVVMYFATINCIAANSDLKPSRKRFFAIYSTILLLLLTIDTSTNAVWGEIMWIKGRNHEGGVLGWFVENVSAWYETLGSTSVAAMIFIGDALLLQRLFVLWNGNWWIMVIPILAYLAGFAVAIIELVIAGKPGGNFFGGRTINFGLPYYSITIGLNIVVTALISFRLLRLSRAISRVLGGDSSRIYTNLVTILVESAAPYSIIGIVFLIPYGMGSDTFIGFGQVWAKLTCLCPQLIVLRIASGKAWERKLVTQAESTLSFDQGRQSGATTQVELRDHGKAKLDFGSADGQCPQPERFRVSTFAESTEKWKSWDSGRGSGKFDV